MDAYLAIVDNVLSQGDTKENRTGIDALSLFGQIFKHDMSTGFPLVTTKRMIPRLIFSELEFFIRGHTDKRWLQERDNHIWDAWCTPEKVPYGHDVETKKRMRDEPDLGPVYGWQWRYFGATYRGYGIDYAGKGVDQLARIVDILKTDSDDRTMVVSAWNPLDLEKMARPPCHYSFTVSVNDDRLDLKWNQRSVDVMLGLPFNIASYGTLLHLLAKESGFEEGTLTGSLEDVHIYRNHIPNARKQLEKRPYPTPRIETAQFSSIFDWEHTDTEIEGYVSHPPIKFEIAV